MVKYGTTLWPLLVCTIIRLRFRTAHVAAISSLHKHINHWQTLSNNITHFFSFKQDNTILINTYLSSHVKTYLSLHIILEELILAATLLLLNAAVTVTFALLCCRTVVACQKLTSLYLDATKDYCQAVLDAIHQTDKFITKGYISGRSMHLFVPGR